MEEHNADRRAFLKVAAGCGEPTITAMAAVIANALFDATGARLTRLPLTPERVKAALR